MRKRSLRYRILLYITLALILATIVSTVVAYSYFSMIIREQKIVDEQIKLRQIVNQLDFMVDDIQNFSKNIAVDPVIQESLKISEFKDEFERTKNNSAVRERLVFYNSLRGYIPISYIKGNNGEYYSSKFNTGQEYYNSKLTQPEIETYVQSKDQIFSDPYHAIEVEISKDVMAYRIHIRDMENPGSEIGELYLDIHQSFFSRQIDNYAVEYEDAWLIGNTENILYQKSSESELTSFVSGQNADNYQEIQKVSGGYLISEQVTSTGWILSSYISNRYLWEQVQFVLEFFLLFFLLTTVILFYLISKILGTMIRPITDLTTAMETIEYEHMDTTLEIHTGDEIEQLYHKFRQMLKEIREHIDQKIEMEKRGKELEFDILLSQINPHYLYNVLNTVVYIAVLEENPKIEEIVRSLLYTLQDTLKIGEENLYTTVQDELDLIEHYLMIQKYRYSDLFSVKKNVSKDAKHCIIPKTIIQPLVENALYHGIIPGEVPGTIIISVTTVKDTLSIVVEDDGVGFSENNKASFDCGEEIEYDTKNRKHIGLTNIRDRLLFLYPGKAKMQIEIRQPHGTRITIQLPMKK